MLPPPETVDAVKPNRPRSIAAEPIFYLFCSKTLSKSFCRTKQQNAGEISQFTIIYINFQILLDKLWTNMYNFDKEGNENFENIVDFYQ